MSTRLIGNLGLAVVPALLIGTSVGPDDEKTIELSPEEGTVLRKTFTRELELTLEGGSLGHLGYLADPLQVGATSWNDEQRVVLTDEYGPVHEGRPLRLARRFDELFTSHGHALGLNASPVGPLEIDLPREGRGEIEGTTVVFTWDEEEGEYRRSWGPGVDLDDALLEGLEGGADLREILPWKDVSPGDVWFTDVEIFRQICWPGGAIAYLNRENQYLVRPVDRRLAENLDGTFRVEYAKSIRRGGVRIAVLEIWGILEATTVFEHDLDLSYMSYDLELAVRQNLRLYLVARGSLHWNLDSDHLDSCRLEGDVTVQQKAAVAVRTVRDLPDYSPDDSLLTGEWRGRLRTRVDVSPVARSEVGDAFEDR